MPPSGTVCGGGIKPNSDIVTKFSNFFIMTPPITLYFFNYNINLNTVKTDIVNFGENLKRKK